MISTRGKSNMDQGLKEEKYEIIQIKGGTEG